MSNTALQQASATTSTIDRLQASKLLKVSVRTIDRYIKSGKLAAYQKSGRIWLKKSDVVEMGRGSLVMKPAGSNIENHSPIRGTGARSAPSVQEINAALHSAPPLEAQENTFYKELYEEAQKRLNEYQHKLEQSNIRMGDLEAHIVRTSATALNQMAQPMTKQIERVEASKDDRFEIEMLKKELAEKDKNTTELKALYEREKSNKNVFAILTYILLALQPVFWYFLV